MSYMNKPEWTNIGTIIPMNPNLIEVLGLPLIRGGIILYSDSDVLWGDYSKFKIIYKVINETTIQYTNSGEYKRNNPPSN